MKKPRKVMCMECKRLPAVCSWGSRKVKGTFVPNMLCQICAERKQSVVETHPTPKAFLDDANEVWTPVDRSREA